MLCYGYHEQRRCQRRVDGIVYSQFGEDMIEKLPLGAFLFAIEQRVEIRIELKIELNSQK